jgi:hypothetical protein
MFLIVEIIPPLSGRNLRCLRVHFELDFHSVEMVEVVEVFL